MTWVKLDDQITEHPKVLQAGPFGFALYVAAIVYCNRNLTDGFVPRAAMATLLCNEWEDTDGRLWKAAQVCGMRGDDCDSLQTAEGLVDSGLLHHAPGGYHVHDYLDYQPSKEKVLGERQGAAERMRRLRSPDVRPKFNDPVPVPEDSTSRPVAESRGEPQEKQEQPVSTARSAAELLAAAILPEHRDEGTRTVVLAYAAELEATDFTAVLRELQKRRGTIRNEAKWVNGALGRRARKKAAA